MKSIISKIIPKEYRPNHVLTTRYIEQQPTYTEYENLLPSLCDYNDLVCLDEDTLMSNMTYHYNACIVPYKEGYRLFYRTGIEPKMIHDYIATCLLTKDLKVVKDSNKIVKTYSNGEQVMKDMKQMFYQHNMINDSQHCEDPRAVEHKGFWYLTYTDGFRVGIAKLDLETCETMYSHYLFPPQTVKNGISDGREKNWIPYSDGDYLSFIYSDNPRTIIRYTDKETYLEQSPLITKFPKTDCAFGTVRGGSTPVKYDNNHYIWFFHTASDLKYTCGAYITLGYEKVIYVFKDPILVGQPQPKFLTKKTIKNNIVYPCGAVETDSGWIVSFGINDYKVGFLPIKRSLIEKNIPIHVIKSIQSKNPPPLPIS